MTPSSGFVKLLKQFTELGETLDYQVLLSKDTTQEPAADGREAHGKVWEGGLEIPCPLSVQPPRDQQPRSSLNPVFLLSFSEVPLHWYDGLNLYPWVIELSLWPLSPPQRSGGGTASFSPFLAKLVPQATSPPPKVGFKSRLINITKDTIRSSVLGTTDHIEDQIYISS